MIFSIRGFSGGGTSRPAGGGNISTGGLIANVKKTLTHNFGLRDYQLQAFVSGTRTANNNVLLKTLKKDPADPLNKIIVESSINLLVGVQISIIGY